MEHRIRSAAIIVQEDSESSWFGKLTTGKLTTNGMNNTARPDDAYAITPQPEGCGMMPPRLRGGRNSLPFALSVSKGVPTKRDASTSGCA